MKLRAVLRSGLIALTLAAGCATEMQHNTTKVPFPSDWREGEAKFCVTIGMPNSPKEQDDYAARNPDSHALGISFKPKDPKIVNHSLDEIAQACGKPHRIYTDHDGTMYVYGRFAITSKDGRTISTVWIMKDVDQWK